MCESLGFLVGLDPCRDSVSPESLFAALHDVRGAFLLGWLLLDSVGYA